MAGDASGRTRTRRARRWPAVLLGLLSALATLAAHAAAQEARPVLRFGGDAHYPPYHFIGEDGEPTGFDVELAQAIGADLGMDVRIELDEWGATLERLERGELDVVPMFRSPERSERFVFTEPILLRHHGLFGHYETPTVESLEALVNARVAVQSSGLAWEALRALDRPGVVVIAIDNEAETLELVRRGEADYALAPTGIGYYAIQHSHLPGIVALSPPLLERAYVFGLPRTHAALADRLDASLEHLRRDGVQNALYVKWIGNPAAEPPRGGVPWATALLAGGALVALSAFLVVRARRRRPADAGPAAAAPGARKSVVPVDPVLLDELHAAIESRALDFALQPKVDLRTGRVLGGELLVRWNHPRLGSLEPDAFVPMAEQAGRIGEMTLYLVRHGLAHCRRWPERLQPLHVSINVSANDLADPALVDEIISAVNGGGPSLMLEITETEVMEEPALVAAALPRLRAKGIRVSVDDFGAGHSSLVNLRRLAPDELKIDRSFVRSLLASHSDRAIVRATIHLAHELGARVAAEGIEDEATRSWLMRAGCDAGQGYLISPPLGPEAFIALLERQD